MITGRDDGAVEQHGQVELLLDVRRGGDEQLADEPALRAGLLGDEHVAQHGLGLLANFLRRLAQLDAALEAALEGAFAAAAGVDLRFDGDEIGAVGEELLGDASWPPPACRRRPRAARQRRIGASSCLAWYS